MQISHPCNPPSKNPGYGPESCNFNIVGDNFFLLVAKFVISVHRESDPVQLIYWNESASKIDPGSLIVNTLIILPHLASVKDIFHFDMLYTLGTQHGFSSDRKKFLVTLMD